MSPKYLKPPKTATPANDNLSPDADALPHAHTGRSQRETEHAERTVTDPPGRGAGGTRPAGASALARGRWAVAEHGPARLLAHLPRAKLTALGNGLLASAVMLCLGFVCSWLLNGSTTTYGVCFLLLSAVCALWVRLADALTAPVAVPIAFAFGLLPMGEGEGVGAWFVELMTTLAVNAGWLYGGTLLTVVIVVVRRGIRAARRRRERRSPSLRRSTTRA